MSKVPHLLKGSALPDGEQRRLAEYASAHPKSALHRKGQHHDAAVLLVHGIGYQNHGETLAYFGKPVVHSVQTLLALNTDSVAPSEENPDAEASARVRVEVIPDGDTLPPAAEVNPLSVVPLVASVSGSLKGRARIAHKSAATSSAKSPADVRLADARLVNPYGTRAYVKWLIPLLFVHGVFMLYAVFMLLLAQLRVEGAVPELTAASVVFWGALILVLMMSVRSACHLYVRAYAPMLQDLDVADRCEISARGDSIGRSNITQPADVDVSFVTLPGPSVNSHMQYFDACSPVPLMLAHRLVPHMMPAGEQAQKAAAFTDIGAELNHGFARVKKWMRTMHYGLYALLLLMLSVLLSVASPVSLSALTGLDTSHLHSEGFDRLVADAQQLREQAGSSDLLLWILVGIFVVEALLMMVLSPWTQRRLQRAFMMRKVDRTGQLSEFNPLPMVTALLGLDGEDEDAEDAEEHNLAGEKKQESKAGQSAVV